MSKIEAFWVNATADDVAGIVKTGKPIPARVRDEGSEDWLDCLLVGWKLSKHLPGARWIDADGAMWNHCQVYREPSWHANKPDPGPGYRLLEKFPDEELKPGDESWDVWGDKQWRESDSANGGLPQGKDIWYRRRIEPVEPKFAVGQTVRVVGPKVKPARNWTAAMDEHIEQVYTVISVQSYPNHPSGTADFYSVKGVVEWAFREDYLEAVEPVESKPVLIRRRVVEIGDEIKLPNGRVLVFNGEGFEVSQ